MSIAEARAAFAEGRFPEAAEQCRRLIAAHGEVVEALTLLGSIAVTGGATTTALGLLDVAAAAAPEDIRPRNALGLAHRAAGDLAAAAACFAAVLRQQPERAEVRRNLAGVRLGLGEWAAAEQLYAALAAQGRLRDPDWLDYAQAVAGAGAPARAVALLSDRTFPDQPELWLRLARLYAACRVPPQAVIAYRRCLALAPGHLAASLELGDIFLDGQNAETAAAVYREALRIHPDHPVLLFRLGIALNRVGQPAAAAAPLARAVALAPEDSVIHAAAMFNALYLDGTTPAEILESHRSWASRFARVAPVPRTPRQADPDRRLRVGYVSADFRRHVCFTFLEPLLRHRDPREAEVFLYGNSAIADERTRWAQAQADGWRDLQGMPDGEAAALIDRDRIDILVDLSGHSSGHRLGVFARRPAPVSVTWLGYPTTTGLDTIDYRLSDRWLTPDDSREGFSEQLYRLDRISHCYAPPDDAPPVGDPPFLRQGFVSFGCFNSWSKISDQAIRTWARLLHAVPEARLVLKSPNLVTSQARAFQQERLTTAGADLRRVVLLDGQESFAGHLAAHGAIDIALDSFPYGGMTSSCEALWMGVPLITRAGDRTSGRYGVSLLAALGLDELIGRDDDDYVARAATLAGDRDRLVALRRTLRPTMAASPLCHGADFTAAVERALRTMWRRWCAPCP